MSRMSTSSQAYGIRTTGVLTTLMDTTTPSLVLDSSAGLLIMVPSARSELAQSGLLTTIMMNGSLTSLLAQSSSRRREANTQGKATALSGTDLAGATADMPTKSEMPSAFDDLQQTKHLSLFSLKIWIKL